MRLRKIEYELKQKELEMELHRLEEKAPTAIKSSNVRSNCKTTRKPSIPDSGSGDGAAPSIRSRSPFNWKSPRGKDIFGWLDQADKFANFKDCSFDHTKNGQENYRVSLIEKAYLNPDPQAASISNSTVYPTGLSATY